MVQNFGFGTLARVAWFVRGQQLCTTKAGGMAVCIMIIVNLIMAVCVMIIINLILPASPERSTRRPSQKAGRPPARSFAWQPLSRMFHLFGKRENANQADLIQGRTWFTALATAAQQLLGVLLVHCVSSE